ncbi:primosomal protein N' [Candidatus Saccharibacteria bacterium]|nr:primosomal protein N' [Candidatus Saccharibacteria bacterium]
MFYEVIPNRTLGQDTDVLTYSFDSLLVPGQIVQIPIGRTKAVGIIRKKVAQPSFTTKSILQVFYSKPLPAHLLSLIDFMHDYYLVPRPQAVSLLLPKGIEKKRRNHPLKPEQTEKTEQNSLKIAKTEQSPIDLLSTISKTEQPSEKLKIPLNNAQKNALLALQEAPEATKLLHGVTGSGKTNIYLKMAENALKQQKSTILLVPEIALTSQLVRVFAETFDQKITLIHSRQTEAERHLIWDQLLKTNTEPHIIIGPRSALFAPLENLGLIIIDECHESTYFQENSPKYSTLRLASFIAKTLKIDCVEGSATPLIQDYYLAKTRGSLITLTEKAKDTAKAPDIKVIDFKTRDNFSKNRYFSNALIESIQQNIKNHTGTLIFHNRRGSSPLTICEQCGNELLCPNCFLPLTLHSDTYELICHTCGHKEKVPHSCPSCGSPNIIHKGFGTKLLESELKKLFKDAKIARFDADNDKNHTLDALYDEVKNGNYDIIIGTQTVAKGLDLPKLATVGVVQADAGLSLPDYAAEERTFELLTQVIGRVGRGHLDKAEVIIQTFRPDHPVINFATHADYAGFSDYLIKKQKQSNFPPFTYVAKLEVTMKTEAIVVKKIRQVYRSLSQNPKLLLSVPTPTFHEHNSRGFTWQIILRAKSRATIINALKSQKLDKSFHITLDPPSLL